MQVQLHVKSIEEAAEKQPAAQALLSEGDELVVIIAQPGAGAAAQAQPSKQAVYGGDQR